MALVNSDFVDLDRDGRLDVVSARQVNGERIFDVFGFDGIHFAPRQSLNFFGTFFRHSGAPDLTTEVFNVGRTDLAYVVRILNGDSTGMNRVSSAVIGLNGVVVAGPERFNQKVAEILIPVNLQASNELMVELRGGPGGEITILVEPRQ